MDNGQLGEMFNYVKGKGVARKGTSQNLGKIVSHYMDGDIPTLVLDTEREIDANSISNGNFIIIESSNDTRQPDRNTGRQTNTNNPIVDDGQFDDDVDITKTIKATPTVNLGKSTEDGIPILMPDPEFIDHATEIQLGILNVDTRAPNNDTNSPLKSVTPKTNINNQSPALILLSKAKTKKINIELKLEIEAYDESLITVLIDNYGDEAKEDAINFMIDKIDNKILKDAIAEQLKSAYKSLNNG